MKKVISMRVIAGDLRGRTIHAPKGTATRPTTDRVREAIFSMIGPFFHGGICLDLFAGSGALGIEAISRGMDKSIFVDISSSETIDDNVKKLGIDKQAQVYALSYSKAIQRIARIGLQVTVVFLDPPYQLGVLEDALRSLVVAKILSPHAVLVAEMDQKTMTPDILSLHVRKEVRYGSTKVVIYDYDASIDE
ncbi:MAG: 16S rRNA (guanine(966)-N(2))-methyltransferase RsmD [Acidibacillus sp.]|nr:16S rRNA (guanine(966)-N(2))-methyltransferase RsmD [Sulfoacidibacillus ferrooxidans]MCY0892988.1 16S rRNA (guanine(966)-N(2))-methyltransferase RsmD [Acidibacillus sp.]